MSTGDPDLDAVMQESQQQPTTANAPSGDPDLDAVLSEKPKTPTPDDAVRDLVLNKASGMGASVLGGFRAIGDLASGRSIADSDTRYQQYVKEHTYQPRGEAGQGLVDVSNKVERSPYNPLTWPGRGIEAAGKLINAFGDPNFQIGGNPALYAKTGNPKYKPSDLPSTGGPTDVGPMLVGAGEFLAGASVPTASLAGRTPTWARPVAPWNDGIPSELAAASRGETERLAAVDSRARQLGIQLPEANSSPETHARLAATNTPTNNNVVRQHFNLPQDAPLTPKMMDAVAEHTAKTTYGPVRQLSSVELGEDYQAAVKGLPPPPEGFKPKYSLPTGENITGEEAVNLSRRFRHEAGRQEDFASGAGGPDAEDRADWYRGAANAIEGAVRKQFEKNGTPELADQWEAGRTRIAQTYDVRGALDGAGNIVPSKLARLQQRGVPLSGDLQVLAETAAKYPKAMKTSPEGLPRVSLARKAAAAALPPVAAGAGGLLGGPLGATVGAAVGKGMADKTLTR
jgi:hypothetical protein